MAISPLHICCKSNYDIHVYLCRTMATILRPIYGHSVSRRSRWLVVRHRITNIPQWRFWCWRCRMTHQLWTPPRTTRISIKRTGKHSEKWSSTVYRKIPPRGKSDGSFLFFFQKLLVFREILLCGFLLFLLQLTILSFISLYIVFRPTATELLKHPFFKKAKDKKYLQQTLVAIGPSLETRVQKVRTYIYILFS